MVIFVYKLLSALFISLRCIARSGITEPEGRISFTDLEACCHITFQDCNNLHGVFLS